MNKKKNTSKKHNLSLFPQLLFEPGQNFGKRYTIIEEIGHGGMSIVYKVIDKNVADQQNKEQNEIIAIKMMRPDKLNFPGALDILKHEVRLGRTITHKNVIRIHDLDEINGIKYIKMAYINGLNLNKVIKLVKQFSAETFCSIITQISDALIEAHNNDIVHLDLKPSNIMVDTNGQVFVLDFGIARALLDNDETFSGGTTGYMSPEQYKRQHIDHRTDIYQLGIIMYKMLTSQHPLKDKDKYPQLRTDLWAHNQDIPWQLRLILLKCFEDNPDARYQSVEEIQRDIQKFLKCKHGAITETDNNLSTWLPYHQDHVIICGLGQKGFQIAKQFCEKRNNVIIIEKNENNGLIESCRNLGAIILIGDATDAELLRKANISKANYLFSLCKDDFTNVHIADCVRELSDKEDETILRCFFHILEPDICHFLKELMIEKGLPEVLRFEYFNILDNAARLWINEHPFFYDKIKTKSPSPHLFIIGFGYLGEKLLVHAARKWKSYKQKNKLRVTIIDKKISERIAKVYCQYPKLEEICNIRGLQMDVNSAEFMKFAFLYNKKEVCDASSFYLCLGEDKLNFRTAIKLHHHLDSDKIPIVISFINEIIPPHLSLYKNLHSFSLIERTCQIDELKGGMKEILACAAHEDWFEKQLELGKKIGETPNIFPWEKLLPENKKPNYTHADRIGEHLRAIHCGIKPLIDWDAEQFKFTDSEIEVMAQMEHKSWVKEKKKLGWKHGKRDDNNKIHPDITSWNNLTDASKNINRNEVRAYPRILAKADLQVYRLKK